MAINLENYRPGPGLSYYFHYMKYDFVVEEARKRTCRYGEFIINLKVSEDSSLREETLYVLMGKICNKRHGIIEYIEPRILKLKLFKPSKSLLRSSKSKINVKKLLHKLERIVEDEVKLIKGLLSKNFRFEGLQLCSEICNTEGTRDVLKQLIEMIIVDKYIRRTHPVEMEYTYKRFLALRTFRMFLYTAGKTMCDGTLKRFAKIIAVAKENGFSEQEAMICLKKIILKRYIKDVEIGMYQFFSDWIAKKKKEYIGCRSSIINKRTIHEAGINEYKRYFYTLDCASRLLSKGLNKSTRKLIQINVRLIRYCELLVELHKEVKFINCIGCCSGF